MNLQDILVGVVSAATGTVNQSEAETEKETASGGFLGSAWSAAFSSVGGAQLADKLNSVTGFLSPELKADLVGTALNKIRASGTDVKSLLAQLGINPIIADNPDEATPEELAQLSEHLHERGEEINGESFVAQEFRPPVTAQADEQGEEVEAEDNFEASDAGEETNDES